MIQWNIQNNWNKYGGNANGVLDKEVCRRFIKEVMRNIDAKFIYTEEKFDEVFASCDADGSGDIDSDEMIGLIKELLKK